MGVEIGGARRLSYSQFSSYVTCAKQYQLSRLVPNIEEVPAWYLVGGSAVHRTTEDVDWGMEGDTGRLAKLSSATWWKDIFHEEIERVEEKSGVPRSDWRAGGRPSKEWPHRENYDWWLKNGAAMVQRYVTWRENTRPALPLWVAPTGEPGIELALVTKIGGVEVKMIIDRVFATGKHLMITDIKCGRLPEQTFQLGFYRAGLLAEYGVNAVIGSYWMGRDGGLSEFYGLGHYTPELLGAYLRDFVKAVDNGIFLPHPTRLCQSCAVRKYCAVMDGELASQFDPVLTGDVNVRGMELSGQS
jgi:hypothetical protein